MTRYIDKYHSIASLLLSTHVPKARAQLLQILVHFVGHKSIAVRRLAAEQLNAIILKNATVVVQQENDAVNTQQMLSNYLYENGFHLLFFLILLIGKEMLQKMTEPHNKFSNSFTVSCNCNHHGKKAQQPRQTWETRKTRL